MAGIHTELAKVAAEIEAINNAMLSAAKTPGSSTLNGKFLRSYADEVHNARKGLLSAVEAQGQFGIQSMKVASQADRLTEMIQRQKFGLRDLISEHKNLGEVYKKQMALQKSMVMQWGTAANGMQSADLFTPRNLDMSARGFDNLAKKAGFYNQVLSSVSDQTIKWGKNTQWAGRQLTAGISMPVAAAAAGMGALAYQVDKGLTQVVKVYGDAATAAQTSDAQIRQSTMQTAKAMAGAYGQSVTDSIEITSQLASAGETGNELQQATAQVTRARTLGELNLQDAMKATITLQSVYNMNSQKLGETFDFMNSMENQTSLTMQDFVVGIPKVSGVLKEFGGDVQDAGILLAGMKAAGIDAAEGANAIKSIAFKVIAPNQGSKDMFESLTGKSFEDTMAGTEGVVERLTALGQAIQGLSEEDRVGLIQKMFGLYQGSKTLSLLGQLTNESEQMSRAFEVANGDAATWAQTAERELSKLQNSGWNKVKQQWELLKVELAEVGETFLQMGAPILKFFVDLIKGFNSLPDGVKKFMLVGAVVAAMIGPIIMLAGLFGNMIGNIGKLTTFLTGLALKFKILDAEQVVAARLARQQSGLVINEAEAYSFLAAEIRKATAAMRDASLAQSLRNNGMAGAMPHPRTGNIVVPTGDGKYRPLNKKQQGTYQGIMDEAAGPSTIVANNAEKTARSWKNINASTVAYGVAGVAAVTSMVGPSNDVLNNITNAVLIGATLGPMVVPQLKKIVALNQMMIFAGGKTSAAFTKIGSGISKVVPKAGMLGKSFMGFLPALGPVGLAIGAIGAAVGAAFYVINKNIAKTREETQQYVQSAKSYAEVLGFAYTEAGERVDEQGNKVKTLGAMTTEFMEKNKGAAKEFSRIADSGASEQEKMNVAILEGIKARNHGATEAQAKQVAIIALRAMRSQFSEEELTAKVNFDFGDAKASVERQMDSLVDVMKKASQNKFEQGNSEGIARFFTGTSDINTKAAEMIRGQATEMWEIFNKADASEQAKVFEEIRQRTMAQQQETFSVLEKNHKLQFAEAGIMNANDLARWVAPGGGLDMTGNSLGMSVNEIENYRREMDAVQMMIQEIGKKAGLSEPELKKMLDLSQIRDALPWLKDMSTGIQSVSESQKQWDNFLNESKGSIVKWTEAEKLARLNLYRRRAGLNEATSVEQGFSDEVVKSTGALYDNANAHKAVADAMRARTGLGDGGARLDMNEENVGTMMNSYKDAFSGAMDTVYSTASQIMDAQNAAVMDGIESRGQAAKDYLDRVQDQMEDRFDKQTEALKNRQDKAKKAVEAAYDARIEKVDAAIKAEQKAEDTRQKIFEAEKRRIERLADMYNRNIDISMAISSGKLDEAAKLSNDATATQQGWLLDDAAMASGDQSAARQEAQQKQKDNLQRAKDQALELLDTRQKAEEKALRSTQDNEKKKLEARKKALDASLRAETDTARRRQEANKRALDIELAQLRAHIPQNETQLNAHIGRVEAAYGKYGIRLQGKGSGWANVIGTALQKSTAIAVTKMSNDIAWAALGKVAADKMTQGAFNMNLNEFMKWVMTGETPKNYQAPSKFTKADVAKYNKMGIRVAGVNSQGGLTMHSGGVIGKDRGARTGFSGNGLSQSEVMINALKGEAVLNRNATRTLGTDFVDMANKGQIPKNIGGPDMLTGMGGMMTAMMGAALRKSMAMGILSRGLIKQQAESGAAGMDYSATAGKAGRYGGSVFNAEQLRNAGIIASTGKSMGASNRDIIIALMTAMQESTLRNLNYGDRDSLGLFQQRNAWGSAAERMNPVAATRMFFGGGHQGQRGLFDFPGRGKMTLGQAAQAVQVSAFPGAYDKWSDEAAAILSSLSFSSTGSVSGVAGMGGWVRPANGPRTSAYGYRIHPITGERRLHAGTDIGAPSGAIIRAAKNGKVVSAGWAGGYGNYTIIDHGNGQRTAYGHQSRIGVRAGQTVKAGQTIGNVGNTGASTGPHLHFEYLKNGVRVNPGQIIPGLKTGGFAMSDGLANLHAGEAVIPARLTEQFKQNVANTTENGYNVNMDFRGATFAKDFDTDKFQRAVETALLNVEKRKGSSRKVGS